MAHVRRAVPILDDDDDGDLAAAADGGAGGSAAPAIELIAPPLPPLGAWDAALARHADMLALVCLLLACAFLMRALYVVVRRYRRDNCPPAPAAPVRADRAALLRGATAAASAPPPPPPPPAPSAGWWAWLTPRGAVTPDDAVTRKVKKLY